MKRHVFLSYCWKDKEIADEIGAYLEQNPDLVIHRDTVDIGPWESIKRYMESITEMDYAVLLISESYLHSMNCMYEVMELMRDRIYAKRIFPAVVNHDIYIPEKRAGYVRYWQDKFADLEAELRGVRLENLGHLGYDLKKIQNICANIADFLNLVSEFNNPSIRDVGKYIESVIRAQIEPESSDDAKADEEYKIGCLYEWGEEGYEKNHELARKYYLAAAVKGHAIAQFNLALLYLHGKGGDKEPEKAKKYMTLSANQGFIPACYNLGLIHYHGITGKRKLESAQYWFKIADEEGHENARVWLERCEKEIKQQTGWAMSVYEKSCKRMRISIEGLSYYKNTSNDVLINGNIEACDDYVHRGYLSVKASFCDAEGRVLYTLKSHERYDIEYTGFDSFQLSCVQLDRFVDIDSIHSIIVYPYIQVE